MKDNFKVRRLPGMRWDSRVWIQSLLLLAGIMLLAGCAKHQESVAPPPELPTVRVRTQTVDNRQLPVLEEVVGTVRAKLRATIEAKTTGRISEIPVVLGQKIQAGELLARLDAPEIKARLDQAVASLEQAERDWKRASSLFNQQAATRADYDAAGSRYLVAKGALAEAQAMLGYVEILAPFNGVITKKWVDVGDQAAPGKPLVDMEDPTNLQLEADVPEAIATSVHPGARLSVRAGERSRDLAGTVTEMAPVADPTSRTFRVKLDLPTPAGLMSGQFTRLLVPISQTASMRVPASAVVERGQMEIVFAVENQRARLHLVKTGRRVNDETEILAGLAVGDLVVVENPQQLIDGQPVQGTQ